jgi:hypothetical protein
MTRGSRRNRKAKKALARRAKRAVQQKAAAIVAEQLPPLGRATRERLLQAGDGGSETDPTGRQRIVAAPLDRLLATGFITQREYDAGDELRADAYLAAIDPGALTVDWARTSGGFSARVPSMFSAQHIADARLRHRELRKLITGTVWRTLELAVVLEVDLPQVGRMVFAIGDAREATVATRAALRVALASLADLYEHHWGLALRVAAGRLNGSRGRTT